MKKLLIYLAFIAIAMQAMVHYWVGEQPKYQTYAQQQAAQAQTIAATQATFGRGYTNKQNQPCKNDHTNAYYESELISKNETAHYLLQAGATIQQADILSAISHAESGSQINCFGDDSNKYYGKPTNNGKHYGESYGLFQIRTILEDSNTGSCRDIERLRLNIAQQSICAYEISRSGTNYQPWSVFTTTNPQRSYKRYLGGNW